MDEKLEQPYRRVSKVVDEVVSVAWSAIEKKHPEAALDTSALYGGESKKVKRTMEPRIICAEEVDMVRLFETESKVVVVAATVEGRIALFEEGGEATIVSPFDDGAQIVAMSTPSLFLGSVRMAIASFDVVALMEATPSDAETGPRLTVLTTFKTKTKVKTLNLSSDGKWLAVADVNGYTRLHKVPTTDDFEIKGSVVENTIREEDFLEEEKKPGLFASVTDVLLEVPGPGVVLKIIPKETTRDTSSKTTKKSAGKKNNAKEVLEEAPPPEEDEMSCFEAPQIHFLTMAKKQEDEEVVDLAPKSVLFRWSNSSVLRKFSLLKSEGKTMTEWAMPSNATASAITDDVAAIGLASGTVFLYDSSLNVCLDVLKRHKTEVTALAFQEHRRLATCAQDGSLHVYDLTSRDNFQILACLSVPSPHYLGIFQSAGIAIAGSLENGLLAVDLDDGTILGDLLMAENKREAASFADDAFVAQTTKGLAVFTAQDLMRQLGNPQKILTGPTWTTPSIPSSQQQQQQQQQPILRPGRSLRTTDSRSSLGGGGGGGGGSVSFGLVGELTATNLVHKDNHHKTGSSRCFIDVKDVVDEAIEASLNDRGRHEAQLPNVFRNIHKSLNHSVYLYIASWAGSSLMRASRSSLTSSLLSV